MIQVNHFSYVYQCWRMKVSLMIIAFFRLWAIRGRGTIFANLHFRNESLTPRWNTFPCLFIRPLPYLENRLNRRVRLRVYNKLPREVQVADGKLSTTKENNPRERSQTLAFKRTPVSKTTENIEKFLLTRTTLHLHSFLIFTYLTFWMN